MSLPEKRKREDGSPDNCPDEKSSTKLLTELLKKLKTVHGSYFENVRFLMVFQKLHFPEKSLEECAKFILESVSDGSCSHLLNLYIAVEACELGNVGKRQFLVSIFRMLMNTYVHYMIEHKKSEKKLIAVIRIAGQVKVKEDIKNTLYRLRLRKKYVCVLINPDNENLIGMLNRVKYYVAYGEIEKNILEKLLTARGKKLDGKKINSEDVASDLMNGKNLEELGIKPFFRLHPPRGGIRSKLQYPRGVLGDNKKDINKLIERML